MIRWWKYIFCWNFTAILHYQMIVSKLFVPYNHLFLLCFWWFTLVIIILCISIMLHLLLAWVGQKSMTRLQRNLWFALWRRQKNYICWSKDIMYFSRWKFILFILFNPEILVHNSHLCVLASLHTCLYHARPLSYSVLKYGTIFVYTGLFSQGDITIYTPTNKMDRCLVWDQWSKIQVEKAYYQRWHFYLSQQM